MLKPNQFVRSLEFWFHRVSLYVLSWRTVNGDWYFVIIISGPSFGSRVTYLVFIIACLTLYLTFPTSLIEIFAAF